MEGMDALRNRRSIRKFTGLPVDPGTVDRVIQAGTWAPSGLNNQPWKFVVVQEDRALAGKLAACTKYAHVVRAAPVCILVFLDTGESYHREKDIQAVGACVQNMLLAAHMLGLGAVWLGEILNQRQEVERLAEVPGRLELMAAVALGHPAEKKGPCQRKPLEAFVLSRR